MLRALAERGVTPDMVVGSSVGAINGAYYAARPDVTGAESLALIWRGLRRSDVFPFQPFGGFFGFIGLRSHLLDVNRLHALLERHFPIGRLEEAKVRCHVVATDVLSGEEVCLSTGPLSSKRCLRALRSRPSSRRCRSASIGSSTVLWRATLRWQLRLRSARTG